jgi:hypothetical protein
VPQLAAWGPSPNFHDKARRAIAAGEHRLREAAECLAEARKRGATLRQSAKAIGRSPAWVNQLLAWRKSGYKGGAFERSNKSRAFSRTKQQRRPMTGEEALAQNAQAEFQTARAMAVAKLFGADIKRWEDGSAGAPSFGGRGHTWSAPSTK